MNRKARRAAAKRGVSLSSPAPMTGQPIATEALTTRNTDARSLLEEGLAHHRADRLSEAGACYERLLEVEPTNSDAIHLLGAIAQQTGHTDQAVALMRSAIEINPSVAFYHDNLGRVLLDLGHLDEAASCHEKALDITPGDADILGHLAVVRLRQRRHADALAVLHQAIEVEPQSPMLFNWLGDALIGLNEPETAAQAYGQAVSLKADCPDPYFGLGRLWEASGNRDAAIYAYQCYVKLDPSDHRGGQLALAALGAADTPERASVSYIRTLFDGIASDFDNVAESVGYDGSQTLAAMVMEALAPEERSLVIGDLGCGTGLSGMAFQPLARCIDGIDLSAAMIERARARGIYDTAEVGDFLEILADRPDHYDLLVAADVLVHYGDLSPVLQGTGSALKAGGTFAFSIECGDEAPYRVTREHRFAHQADYVADMALKAGFTVEMRRSIALRREGTGDASAMAFVLKRNKTAA